jgi:hypothetical protein
LKTLPINAVGRYCAITLTGKVHFPSGMIAIPISRAARVMVFAPTFIP